MNPSWYKEMQVLRLLHGKLTEELFYNHFFDVPVFLYEGETYELNILKNGLYQRTLNRFYWLEKQND